MPGPVPRPLTEAPLGRLLAGQRSGTPAGVHSSGPAHLATVLYRWDAAACVLLDLHHP
ncbi:hypothetical protein [Streptomyces qinglanensis]|uniref:hypothetical protein n=1 Tax=Streptomyces qinglanensis TaxID=943816 RepID=UPI00040E920C|nr:hypothetical protein [Streptomyces qinglanensis]